MADDEAMELRDCYEHLRSLPLLRVRRLVTQKRFEFLAVRGFVEVANELGLAIPGNSFSPHVPVPIIHNPLSFEDSEQPFEPIIALAQHHRCPTRLLDWTENPTKAAYFAIEDVEESAHDDVCVWALNLRRLAQQQSAVMPFSVPRCDVGYLHRQEGLFTYVEGADLMYLSDGQWPALENLVPNALLQLLLPKRESAELRRLLFVEGIHKAALMPTYDNVAEMVKRQERIWFRH